MVLVRHDQLVAYVVPSAGSTVDIDALLRSVAALVPEYMVPAMVLVLDALPLGPSGKLDRKALPEPVFESSADFRGADSDVEQILSEVFTEVLGVDRVGVDDSFFALGGDSIVSIQLVARARARGVIITPRDVFEQKTVALLASVSTTEGDTADRVVLEELPGGGVGRMPLTPFAQSMIERGGSFDRFVQSVTLDLPVGIDRRGILRTVTEVVDRHDGLRARLVHDDQGWGLEISEPGSVDLDSSIDHIVIDAEAKSEDIMAAASEAVDLSMRHLDPRAGHMLRFVWVDFGRDVPGRLVVIAHHLVVDGVSWRILVPDFVSAWAQIALGTTPELPDVGTSERRWAHALEEEARSEKRLLELDLWRRISATEDPLLGERPFDSATDVQSTVERISVTVPASVTRSLLTAVPDAFRGGVNDGLLAALAVAVRRWRAQRGVEAPATLVQLEGHGREDELVPGADLSRTVGWFTSVFPVRLDLEGIDLDGENAIGAAVKTVKEQMLAIPDKGMGYGLLRYLNAETAAELSQLSSGQISFNYLGRQETGDLPEGIAGWLPASDFENLAVFGDPDMPANKTVDINAIVKGSGETSELVAAFAFPTGVIAPTDAQDLADLWVAALTELADHVTDPAAGGLTPSDVPLLSLTQRDIDAVETLYPKTTDIWSLAPLQSGLQFHALLAGSSLDVYTMQMVLTLEGTVDAARLRRSAQALLDRYENLRTAFVTAADGSSVQVVVNDVDVPWSEHDLSDLSGSAREQAYQALRANEQSTQFDLAAAPLVRFTLVKLSTGEYRLLFANHHILIDGWSMPLLMKDLLFLYAAGGDGSVLPRVASYRMFLSWIARQDHAESARAWARALEDAPEPTILAPASIDREITSRSGAIEISLSAGLSRSLAALGARLGVTVNTVVQAAWGMLLAASTGRDDVVFGATVSGRPAGLPGVESMVGLFINTLPVRVRLDPAETLESALVRLQGEQADLLDHHYLGLTEVQRAAGVGNLFDTLTVFESYPVDEAGLAAQASDIDGMAVTGIESNDSTHYPLTLLIVSDDRIRLTLKYFEDLFDRDQVVAMAARVERILTAVAEDPSQAVGDLDLLDEAERRELLAERNATDHDVEDALLLDEFDRQVERTPEATALTFEGQSITYREFSARTNGLARHLIGKGVGPDTAVAIGIRRSVEMMVGIYAVLRAGGAYVPLDPEQPADRVDYILETSNAVLVLTTVRDEFATGASTDVVFVDDAALERISGDPLPEAERGRTRPDNAAYVLFTSGSTGRPKGVTISHRAIVNRLEWMQDEYRLTESDAVAQKTPVTFDVSVWELFWPLRVGARMVIAKPDGHRDPAYLADLLAAEAISVAHFVPSMLAVFTAEPSAAAASALRWVFASGEALPVATAARLAELLPGTRLVNLYGPTEAAVDVTYHEYTAQDRSGVPIGRPVFNTAVYVLDSALRPAPDGAEGELYLGGVQLARGYSSRPDLTADRFVANPFGPGRLYRTGDVVRWNPAGELDYIGRSDFQVKLRGQRIELGEIESALLADDDIAQAVVAVRGDRLVAWVVLVADVADVADTADTAVPDLTAAVGERLPAYMVPSAFVVLHALPLTSSGKLDRKALPEPSIESAEFRAPTTPIEQIVAEVFTSVLGVDRVGLDDDFFALGGNSLVATQVAARLSAALDAQVPVRALFDASTVAALARRVEDHADSGGRAALVSVPRRTEDGRPKQIPLSSAQQRMWFLNRFDTASAVNNIPVAIRLTGALDSDALSAAVADVVARHETMRTVYPEIDGVGHQVVLAPGDVAVDLSPISVAAQDVLGAVLETVSEGFDVTSEVPLRVRLLAVDECDHVLVFVVHHIAADGFSMRPLTTDVMLAYAARALGETPDWRPLEVQYADYTLWQRAVLGSEDDPSSEASAQVSYWTSQLSGLADQIELPFDHARPAVATNRGRTAQFSVSAELHRSLDSLARRHNASLFMVVHAALAILMSRLSASEDVAIGTPIAGRGDAKLDDLIGMFVNTLVLRTEVSPGTAFDELLAHAREVDLQAFAHADVPFERLVEVLDPQRSQARHPLVQVVLAFQNLGHTALELPGLSAEALQFDAEIAKFDVQFTFEEAAQQGGLTCYVSYAKDLFDASTIEAMGEQFLAVLDAIASDPTTAVGDIAIVDDSTRDRVLTQWSSSGADVSVNAATLVERFDAAVAAHPDGVAVRFEGVSLTFSELDSRANRLARTLIGAGAGPDSLVAVALPRSAELVVALVAVVKAGAGYLPVDPSYPRERIEFMIADAAPVAVVTTAEVAAQESMASIGEAGIAVVDPFAAQSAGVEEDSAPVTDADRLAPLRADNLAYVIYTSGSTGRPKGVLVPHRTVVRLMDNTDSSFGFTSEDVWTMFHSYAFDFSVWELWGPLLYGGTLVMVDYFTSRSPEAFRELLVTERVTVLNQTPSAFYQLAELDRARSADAGELSLRYVVFGGEALEPRRLSGWFDRHGDGSSNGPLLVNMYGITETTVHVSFRALSSDSIGSASVIGAPISGLGVYVLDTRLQPVPVGVAGELYVSGGQLARGYLGRADLSAVRFVANPFGGGRLYRTGDLARWVETGSETGSSTPATGELVYLGRADDQVKIRGFRIELGEIEAAVSAQDSVTAAAVIVREDSPGAQRLVAYVVGTVDTESVRAGVAEMVPEYMVPSAFVSMDEIPLTVNGKLDRKALPEPAQTTAGFRAPSTPVEEIVAGVFADVLGLARVGVNDDFFTLGGNSLMATQVVSRLGSALDTSVPVRLLFEASSVGDLAGRVESAVGRGRVELVARERPQQIPLSLAQRRMWFLNRFDSASTAYNIPMALRLSGHLDTDAFAAAIGDLVERHETLRTIYPDTESGPVQQILSAERADIALAVEDTDADSVTGRVMALAATAFDVTSEVPVRVTLFRITQDEYVVAMVVHHISADGSSMVPLTTDLMTAYAARTSGRTPDWAPLPVQYADYALWQREVLGHEDDPDSVGAEQLGYWRSALADLPDQLTLPIDKPRPADQSFRGDRVEFTVSAHTHAALQELARTHNATVFMAVHAALSVLLSKLSGMNDIAVGTPIAGRGEAVLDNLVGMFVNTLVFRLDVDGGRGFTELLAATRETDLQAFANADVPFERLVEVLNPARSTARHPLFQVGFSFQNVAQTALELGELTVSAVDADSGTSQFDLHLILADRYEDDGAPAGFEALMTYATDLFEESTVRSIVDRFVRVLEAVVADPDAAVGDLPILDSSEQRELVSGWNDTAHEIDAAATLVDLFDDQVQRNPDATALVYEGQSLTYAEFDARVNRVARSLIDRGVGPESLVGLAIRRSVELMVGMYAIVKAGGAYVPIDPDQPAERTRYILDVAQPVCVITTSAEAVDIDGAIDLADLEYAGTDSAPISPSERLSPLRSGNTAYVIFTSGSTGKPKGVAVAHAAIVNQLLWKHAEFGMDATDSVLLKTVATFDLSVWEFWSALTVGASVVIATADGHRDPDYLLALLREQRITTLHVVPSMLSMLSTVAAGSMPSTLRRVLAIGEALPAETARAFRESNSAELFNLYGPTEAAVSITSHRVGEEDTQTVPIGRPEWNSEVLVLDSRLHPVPVGVSGELYLAGAQLARGYHGRADLTADRFVANPFGERGTRAYRTGDIVKWNRAGELEYVERADFQVKVRGYRIELGEIEAALRAQDSVREAAVTVHNDGRTGDQLVAYVVPSATPSDAAGDLDTAAIRTSLTSSLPSYMVPSAFVVLDALPLNTNGKLDRRALPAPDFAVGEFRAPTNPVEEVVASTLADVLGVDRVGLDDDFFALGGNSLIATQVVSRLGAALDTKVPVRTIFEASTVAALAARIQPLVGGGAQVPLLARERPATVPLSLAQQRMWTINQVDTESGAYNIPAAVRFTGALDVSAFAAAMADVIDRHEVLRTRYPDSADGPIQLIGTVADALPDLRPVPVTEAEVYQRVGEVLRGGFDVTSEVPVRAGLFQLDETDHVFALVAHHITADGFSMRPLIRDVMLAYTSRAAGDAPQWAPLPVQYADFSLWQREVLGSEDDPDSALSSQLEFWTQELSGLPDLLPLPTDRPRPARQSTIGEAYEFALGPEISQRLDKTAREHNATVFMVVHSALAVLLARLSGTDDIAIGTPTAGRGEEALDDLVGMFVNTLVLRTRVEGGLTFAELLARTRETDLAAFGHADVPFERLVEAMGRTRSSAYSPLFQVMLTFQNAVSGTFALPGLEVSTLAADEDQAKFDLQLTAIEQFDESGTLQDVRALFNYATSIFTRSTVEKFADRFLRILDAVTQDPSVTLRSIDILSEAERAAFAPKRVARTVDDLPALVSEAAAVDPAAVVLTHDAAEITFEQLHAKLAAVSKAMGATLKPEALVTVALSQLVPGILPALGAEGYAAAVASMIGAAEAVIGR
nr:non-ribosomal peptide synthetase [uncultured Rhodococcus sp.]